MSKFMPIAVGGLTFVPNTFSLVGVPHTRGDILAHCLRFALGKLRIRGFKRLLTDDDRARIADDVVRQLKERPGGAVWRLDEVLPEPQPGNGAQSVWKD